MSDKPNDQKSRAELEAERTKLSPAQEEAQKQGQNERQAAAKKVEDESGPEPSLRDDRRAVDLMPPDTTTPKEFHRDADRRPGDTTPQEREKMEKEGTSDVKQGRLVLPNERQAEIEKAVAEHDKKVAGEGGAPVASPKGMVSSKNP